MALPAACRDGCLSGMPSNRRFDLYFGAAMGPGRNGYVPVMKTLFLVGYMGCGKSTLGRRLAKRLGVPFVDTDALIEQREGAAVADVFQYEGEQRFREVEREVLEELLAGGGDRVVSTGGGLPVWQDNMARMNEAGTTFYLRRSACQIADRLSPYGRQKRPKLRGLSDEELVPFMKHDMAARESFYAQAHTVVDCSSLSDEAVLEFIIDKLLTDNE